MIARLTGTVHRLSPAEAIVDVHGVGYRVSVPVDTWDHVPAEGEATLWTSTYVREDRLELYGFRDRGTLLLFEKLIAQSGIGPKVGLELCAVPREMLARAVREEDAALLSTVKGIGKKRAEKLLVELRAVAEAMPALFEHVTEAGQSGNRFDADAIAALEALGYDTPTILGALKELPSDIATTEERVTAALRSL